MSVIGLASGEKSLKRVVAGNDEAGKVGKELASDVEEDGEEVKGTDAQDYVDLGDRGLGLEVIESTILGELQGDTMLVKTRYYMYYQFKGSICSMKLKIAYLLVELRDLVLSTFLERHGDCGM